MYVSRFERILAGACAAAALLTLASGCSREHRARGDLDDANPVVRAAAAESLGVWRAVEAAAEIRPLLADSVAGVRECAANALGYLGDSSAVSDLLDLTVNDDDSGVRRAAAEALASIAPVKSADALLPLLDGPTATVRLRVATALTTLIRASRDSLPSRTLLETGWALGGVVQSTQTARAELPGNWRGWNAYLHGAIAPEDTGEIVGDQACVALAWLGGEGAGRGLLLALHGTITRELSDSLLSILVIEGDSLITRRLIADTKTRLVSARRRAVRLLGGLPNEQVRDALLGLAKDRAVSVRREVWRSLLRIHGLRLSSSRARVPTFPLSGLSPRAVNAAKKALSEGDPVVFASAALMLVKMGDETAIRAVSVRARRRRLSAATALNVLAEAPGNIAEKNVKTVRRLIVRGVISTKPAVRAAAARALGTWSVPRAASYLVTLLNDPRREVVIAALKAVERRKDSAYLADVLPLIGADSLVQVQAARTLAALVNAQSLNYLILALTTDEIQRRRGAVMAVTIVAERVWKTPQARAYAENLARAGSWLARMAREESDARDRRNAVRALSFIPYDGAEEALGLALGDVSEDVRAAAAVGMARVRPEVSISSLRSLAFRGTKAHKEQAIAALKALDTPSARAVLRAVSVLDSSPNVRRRARLFLRLGTRQGIAAGTSGPASGSPSRSGPFTARRTEIEGAANGLFTGRMRVRW